MEKYGIKNKSQIEMWIDGIVFVGMTMDGCSSSKGRKSNSITPMVFQGRASPGSVDLDELKASEEPKWFSNPSTYLYREWERTKVMKYNNNSGISNLSHSVTKYIEI